VPKTYAVVVAYTDSGPVREPVLDLGEMATTISAMASRHKGPLRLETPGGSWGLNRKTRRAAQSLARRRKRRRLCG
jgi:hypothetical protein